MRNAGVDICLVVKRLTLRVVKPAATAEIFQPSNAEVTDSTAFSSVGMTDNPTYSNTEKMGFAVSGCDEMTDGETSGNLVITSEQAVMMQVRQISVFAQVKEQILWLILYVGVLSILLLFVFDRSLLGDIYYCN